jgi:hypothetical protein
VSSFIGILNQKMFLLWIRTTTLNLVFKFKFGYISICLLIVGDYGTVQGTSFMGNPYEFFECPILSTFFLIFFIYTSNFFFFFLTFFLIGYMQLQRSGIIKIVRRNQICIQLELSFIICLLVYILF